MKFTLRKPSGAFLVGALALGGCNSSNKMTAAREASVTRWNTARSQVKAALAADQLAAGNVSDAAAETESALALRPDDARLKLLRARVALSAGDAAAAARLLESIPNDAKPRSEVDYLLGVVHQQRLHWDAALQAFVRAAEADPTDAACFVAVAQTLLQLGQAPEALEYVAARREAFGGTPAFESIFAECCEQVGDWDGAVSAWQRIADSGRDGSVRERLALALVRAGRTAEARPLLRELVTRSGVSIPAGLRRAYAECLLNEQQIDAARAQLSELLAIDPNDDDARLLLARAHAEQGRFEAALRCTRVVLAHDPANASALEFATAVTYRVGRIPQALELAKRFQLAAPGAPSAVVQHVIDQAERAATSPAAAGAGAGAARERRRTESVQTPVIQSSSARPQPPMPPPPDVSDECEAPVMRETQCDGKELTKQPRAIQDDHAQLHALPPRRTRYCRDCYGTFT